MMYYILNALLLKSQSSMFTNKSSSKHSLILDEFLSTQILDQLSFILTQ